MKIAIVPAVFNTSKLAPNQPKCPFLPEILNVNDITNPKYRNIET